MLTMVVTRLPATSVVKEYDTTLNNVTQLDRASGADLKTILPYFLMIRFKKKIFLSNDARQPEI